MRLEYFSLRAVEWILYGSKTIANDKNNLGTSITRRPLGYGIRQH